MQREVPRSVVRGIEGKDLLGRLGTASIGHAGEQLVEEPPAALSIPVELR